MVEEVYDVVDGVCCGVSMLLLHNVVGKHHLNLKGFAVEQVCCCSAMMWIEKFRVGKVNWQKWLYHINQIKIDMFYV
jgi:hypothetical protein